MDLGSAGGVDLAAAAAGCPAGGACRSPVWFRSSAVADEVQAPGKHQLQSVHTDKQCACLQYVRLKTVVACICRLTSTHGVHATSVHVTYRCMPTAYVLELVICAGARADGQLNASSSAPACGNLFDRFDQVARQQQHAREARQVHSQQNMLQHHHSQPCLQLHDALAQQVPPAGQQGAVGAARDRRLTARRGGSWTGSEQLQR
jgi:hypothetical protein